MPSKVKVHLCRRRLTYRISLPRSRAKVSCPAGTFFLIFNPKLRPPPRFKSLTFLRLLLACISNVAALLLAIYMLASSSHDGCQCAAALSSFGVKLFLEGSCFLQRPKIPRHSWHSLDSSFVF